jgi:uncharacterized protein
MLLSEELCDLFARQEITVGISLDGDKKANDLHRRHANGHSSYEQVIRGIQLLRSDKYRHIYGGILCTIDLRNNPTSVYEALAALEPPRIDLLLPHATWENPPLRLGHSSAEYADWLISIYDRWKLAQSAVPIRTFDSILRTMRGLESLTESLGLDSSDLIVIETDGSYEQADSLKSAYNGAPATGYNVFADSLDTVAEFPGFTTRQRGAAGLCETCRDCRIVTICGGGLYAHRYRVKNGFNNP